MQTTTFGRTLTDEQYAFIERECEPDPTDYEYEDDNEPAFIDYLQDLVLNVEYWSSKFVRLFPLPLNIHLVSPSTPCLVDQVQLLD